MLKGSLGSHPLLSTPHGAGHVRVRGGRKERREEGWLDGRRERERRGTGREEGSRAAGLLRGSHDIFHTGDLL